MPSLTPPSSVSASSGLVVVAPLSASGVQLLAAGLVSGFEQLRPSSVPSNRPSLSLSSSRMFLIPSPSLSSLGFASSPSSTPSSSESSSFGFEPRELSTASLSPSPSVSVTVLSSPGWPAVGLVSPASMTPFRLLSSEPSLAPPPSVSGSSGLVVVAPPSPSAMQ